MWRAGMPAFKASTGEKVDARMWAFVAFYGPIPQGQRVAACPRDLLCVCPDHLTLVAARRSSTQRCGTRGEVTMPMAARGV